jgi:CHAT domain-containing protein/Tfp pilus assembly protein PilF
LALVGCGLALALPPCQAGELSRQAKLQQAAALEKQVEQLRQTHKLVEAAGGLVDLGNILSELRDPAGARKHYEEALAIYRAKLPKDDPRVARSLSNLGNVVGELGDLPAARKHIEEALAIFRAKLPKDDLRIGYSLNNLGVVLRDLRDLAEARKHFEEALAIYRAKLPKDDLRIAQCLHNLGEVLFDLGDLAGARKHFEEVLAIYRAKFPRDDPRIAGSLYNVGLVLWQLGDLPGARKYNEEALALRRAKLPKDDPHIAASLGNLGLVLQVLGDLAGARKCHEEALAIYRAKLPKDDRRIAVSLSNLGLVLQALGDLAGARRHYEQALAIFRAKLAQDDPRIATCLLNLGNVLGDLGDLARARKLYEEALAIRRAKLPRDDPRIADSLNNLGVALSNLGDQPGARRHFEQALAIYRAKLPKGHPNLRFPLEGLMVLERRAGHADKALAYLEEMTYLDLARQERDGLARSEREQLISAAKSRPWVDVLLQVLLRAKRTEQAYDLIAAAKGAVTSRQRWLRLQRDLADNRASKLLDELRSVDTRLLHLGLADAEQKSLPAIDLGKQLQELTQRREELERELIAISPAFRAEKQRARRGLKDIAAAVPDKGVLIDFVEYVPIKTDPKTGKEEPEAAPRLGAFVVRPGPKLHWADLGPSQKLAELVNRWRTGYGASRPSANQPSPAAELRRLLWERLEPHVRGAKVILVAPDGPLIGLPLAALPGSKANSYLLEEYAFVNIPMPQLLPDLIAKTDPRFDRPVSLLLVGDVNFGPPAEPFRPLAGTRSEINDIKDSFQQRFSDAKVTVLRKDKATKQAFTAASHTPRYLHLATHGTFADPSVKSVFALENRARAWRSELLFDRQVVGEHPGLLSGLVFAGANRKDKKSEAILTALEVGEMELRGVELVVLSACDTGLGLVAGGEGVLGLQRAFQVAGARTTVTSLWKVSDRETQQLMSRFYENLWDKKLSKVEALRQAQLWMLREGNVRGLDLPADTKMLPPRYWAAFVLSGDWR